MVLSSSTSILQTYLYKSYNKAKIGQFCKQIMVNKSKLRPSMISKSPKANSNLKHQIESNIYIILKSPSENHFQFQYKNISPMFSIPLTKNQSQLPPFPFTTLISKYKRKKSKYHSTPWISTWTISSIFINKTNIVNVKYNYIISSGKFNFKIICTKNMRSKNQSIMLYKVKFNILENISYSLTIVNHYVSISKK